ncbi:MAG: DUF3465 domain-containing protein [Candidatus Obscuribacterales bacterium]|nr:DUF3465 domain-containing protein [Candidatus Obscuribacterales bacterium]
MNSSQNQDLSASQYKEQNQSQSQNLNSSLIQSDRQAPAANVAVPQGRLFTPVEVNPNPYSNPYSALSSNLATGNGQTGPSFGKAQNNMSVQAQTQSPSQYRTPSIGNSGNYAITQVEDRALVDAQSKHLINFQIEATCRVAELIGDDTRGRPHQRFLLGLSNGTTVLVAHNTSLAPKVPLKPGDIVRIKGEYIWNQKGGVIHYTHHTTNLNHQGGWIQLGSQLYY